MQELLPPGATSSDVLGMNNKGEVVGYAQLTGGTTEAFFWSPGHGMFDLGAGQAMAINQNGAVALAGADGNAYQWTPSTGRRKLGPGTPTAINDHGQIVGNSTNGDAFLWSPGSRR
jgi:probable HAF family extracellular repeat protein